MKRAGAPDEGSGSESKKANTGGGGGGLKGMPGNTDDKVNPIHRPLKLQEITLHFTQRSWEEIGAGELKYLPLSQTPYYMFDNAMLEQLNKFKGLWSTAYYHTPKARLTNLIMLQDDLINQGGTPLETTAFTQACYMLKYTPTRQFQYFELGNIDDCNTGAFTHLTYNLSDTKCGNDYSYLVKLGNYQDFEKLAILPAKIDQYSGFKPRSQVVPVQDTVAYISDTFISPTYENGILANYSANMQPRTKTELFAAPIIPSFKHVTYARNLDTISLHKYGDTVEIPINTNLEGIPLINHINNDFTTRSFKFEDAETSNTYEMYTDFIWPSNNRPYFSRKDNLSSISPFEANKQLSGLNHTFLTMPPIRKANGSLLKQRCSFILEQSFSVTFHTVESIWDNESDKYSLNQKDGIIVRPVLYGLTASVKTDEGAICPSGQLTCTGDKCPYDNSFNSLFSLMISSDFHFFGFQGSETPGAVVYELSEPGELDNTEWINMSGFGAVWVEWIKSATEPGFNQALNVNCKRRAQISLHDRAGTTQQWTADGIAEFIINFSPQSYRNFLQNNGIKCAGSVMHLEFNPVDRDTSLFYM